MRCAHYVALAVVSAATMLNVAANAAESSRAADAADGCVAYGDQKADFTWRLCPAGAKFERQYLYFGVWTRFYPVGSDAGACTWSQAQSSWTCPDRTIRCDAQRCG